MQNLVLRKYQSPDNEDIKKLLMTHYNPESVPRRGQIFDWIAGHNPVAGDEGCYIIIEDGEKIVAYEGRMPVDFVENGKTRTGYFFHDTLVHPEYRKKGMGLSLVNNMKSTWENTTDTFAVGVWMNQFTHEMLKRRRYYEIDAPYFVKTLNMESSLVKTLKSRLLSRIAAGGVKAVSSIYDSFATSSYPEIEIKNIERFDERFDELAEKVSGKFKLITLRHSRYLNWKYVDRPFAGFSILSAEKSGEPAGYVVLLPTKVGQLNVGVIVDILADPEDSRAISALCQASVSFFKDKECAFVTCILTNQDFMKVFRRHLFFRRKKTAPVMIANLEKAANPEMVKDIRNWFLTYGDSDGFVWD